MYHPFFIYISSTGHTAVHAAYSHAEKISAAIRAKEQFADALGLLLDLKALRELEEDDG